MFFLAELAKATVGHLNRPYVITLPLALKTALAFSVSVRVGQEGDRSGENDELAMGIKLTPMLPVSSSMFKVKFVVPSGRRYDPSSRLYPRRIGIL